MEATEEYTRLAKPRRKGILSLVFSRTAIVVLLFAIQILLYVVIYGYSRQYLPGFTAVTEVFQLIMVLYLINCRMDATSKVTWMFLIALFPIAASVFLLMTRTDIGHRKLKGNVARQIEISRNVLGQSEYVLYKLKESGIDDLNHFLNLTGSFPVYDNNEVTFYPLGENAFEAMLESLRGATKYIYLEFFIIEEGYMWGNILDILMEKAKAGVDVRVMYDGMCEITKLPYNYSRLMEAAGIRCRSFSPLRPFLSTYYNYRDHRKIMAIDGRVAFTGGVNLADEYVNRNSRFGHWKDTAIRIRGDAAQSFTVMFLQMWNLREPDAEHGSEFKLPAAVVEAWATRSGGAWTTEKGRAQTAERAGVQTAEKAGAQTVEKAGAWTTEKGRAQTAEKAGVQESEKAEVRISQMTDPVKPSGYVMPFADEPLDQYRVGEIMYVDMLYRANDYVHIMTPYLILNSDTENALKYAAERGVDVKLILPGIPDKKLAYSLAKSHYASLIGAGVKIYEYEPGFVHAKVCVSDDVKAMVGSINLDYRSLYHHFECAAYLYGNDCIADIEKDFEDTLNKCMQVTDESVKKEKLFYKITGPLLKVFAPLM